MSEMSDASGFLKEKWRQAFVYFDVNKDGKITREDFAQIADFISRETNASTEQTNKTREEWIKWIRNLQVDPSVDIDEERFVSQNAEFYCDVAEMKRLNADTWSNMFDRIDSNKNGVISPNEFEIFYKALGRTNKDHVMKIFSKISKDGDGYINREEFIDVFVRFFIDPDPVSGKAYLFSIPS